MNRQKVPGFCIEQEEQPVEQGKSALKDSCKSLVAEVCSAVLPHVRDEALGQHWKDLGEDAALEALA